MSKSPKIDETRLGVNPFVATLEVKANSFGKDEKIIVEVQEGITMPVGSFKNTYVLEATQYTKVFHDVKYRDIVINLSPAALKLWVFITYDLDPNKDYYWMNPSFLSIKLGFKTKKSIPTEELCRYGFLTPTVIENVYWINPAVLFCGNRLKKYPMNIKLRTQ